MRKESATVNVQKHVIKHVWTPQITGYLVSKNSAKSSLGELNRMNSYELTTIKPGDTANLRITPIPATETTRCALPGHC